MKRFHIALLAVCGLCSAVGRGFEPNEADIAEHHEEVYQLARDYIVQTFNLEVTEEGDFNPVRFNSTGVWGDFQARLKELGGDRFEVQGWLAATGHDVAKISWTVHIKYEMADPEGWRYRKVDEVVVIEPEFLGWKFGEYYSIGYQAEYDGSFLARYK